MSYIYKKFKKNNILKSNETGKLCSIYKLYLYNNKL